MRVLGVEARPFGGDRYDCLVNQDERVHERVGDSRVRQGFEDSDAHHRADPGVLESDDLTRISAQLANTVLDFAGSAMELLADSPTNLPRQRFYHLVESRLPEADKAFAHAKLLTEKLNQSRTEPGHQGK